MRISGSSLLGVSSPWASTNTSGSSSRGRSVAARSVLADRHVRLNQARRSMETLLERLEPLRSKRLAGKGARAVGEADLEVNATASTLTSTEEINTTATFYEPHHPEWDGSRSTAPIEITGTYDGRYGDTTLEFRVRRTRTVGGNRTVRLDIYDGSKRVDRVTWSSWSTGPKTSKSGLTVDLGAAGTSVRQNESFWVDVYDSQGTDADLDEAMDTLESELESTVTDGSFTLEGHSIDVFATDSVEDVVDRINAANTGVSAEIINDLFILTRDETGEDDIALGSDSSGFLDAMKLSGATVVLGTDDDVESRVIEEVDALSSVVSGSFTLNGQSFDVDVSTDSLSDVITAINDSGVATATFEAEEGRITLSGARGSSVILADSTGLFAAFDIADGTYKGRRGGGLPRSAREEVIEIVQDFVTEMNEVLSTYGSGALGGLRSVVAGHFDDADLDSGWGLQLDLAGEGQLDASELDRALRVDPEAVFDLLLGQEHGSRESRTGLLEAAIDSLRATEHELGLAHGFTGLIVDVLA